jgi:hypothetical protein
MHDIETLIPTAPPIEQPAVRAHVVWPTALGVIALVFAAFETFGYVIGIVSIIAMSATSSNFDLAQLTSPALAGSPMLSITVIVLDLGLLAAVYAAGFGLFKRRRFGVTAARIFAVGVAVISLASVVVTLLNLDKFRDSELGQLPIQIPVEHLITIITVLSGQVTVCFAFAIMAWFASKRAKSEWSRWR